MRVIDDGTGNTPTVGRPLLNDDADPERLAKRERDRRYKARKKAEREANAGGGTGNGGTDTPPSQPAPGTSGRSPLSDTVDDLKARFANANAANPASPNGGNPSGGPGPAAFTATGLVLLNAMDAIVPRVVASFASRDRVDPVDPATLHLTPKEKELLVPAAQPAEAYLLQNLHPLVIFGIAIAGTFMAKVPPKTKADLQAAKEEREARKAERERNRKPAEHGTGGRSQG